jgi:hypothetical protein
MRVTCLIFALIAVVYTNNSEELLEKRKNKRRKWKSVEVMPETRYDYDSATMPRLRFRTVSNPNLPETWLTLYYGAYVWGQLRFSERNWGVELYACTDDNLYDGKNVMEGVPDGPDRTWEVFWNEERFYIRCNRKNVWTFEFKDAIFPERDCRDVYTGKRGALSQFKFVGNRSGINVPKVYFVQKQKKNKKDKKNKGKK